MNEQQKKWLFIPVLAASLGIPYAMFGGASGIFGGKPQENPAGNLAMYGNNPAQANSAGFPIANGQATGPAPRLEGPAVQDLAEVIRFDIRPEWITQRWSQVFPIKSESKLDGFRVPLVTGTRVDDLAGSLTYYFDNQHVVQRLTFQGSTGDERRLLLLLGKVYQFKEQPSLGGGMFVTTWNGKPTSVLRISYPPVIRANEPNTQKIITLEINRPGEFQQLSKEMHQLIDKDRQQGVW